MKAFLTGVVFTLCVLVMGLYLAVTRGWIPANADVKPGFLETWAAHHSLWATIKREAPTSPIPMALTNANLMAGIKLYSANCAFCHGTSDGQASNIAVGLYQHAPQFARFHDMSQFPTGYIYWLIKHGIRLTGMPAFGNTLTEDQIWQVVLFINHMDNLPPRVERVWKTLPSSKI